MMGERNGSAVLNYEIVGYIRSQVLKNVPCEPLRLAMNEEGLDQIKKQTFRDVYWGDNWKEVNPEAVAHVKTPAFLAMNDQYVFKTYSNNNFAIKVKPHSSSSSKPITHFFGKL